MSENLTMEERIDALEEAKQEILDALEKARKAVRGTSEEGRAKAYWYGHIRTALDRDHGYLGSSMCTLQDAIDDLKHDEEIGPQNFLNERDAIETAQFEKMGESLSVSKSPEGETDEERKGDIFNPPAIEGVEVRQLRTEDGTDNWREEFMKDASKGEDDGK